MSTGNDTNTNLQTDSTITPDHPLFLHQTDHPGLLLISKKLTGSDNYGSWKRSMMIALNDKSKLKIVTGEFTEPGITSSIRALWERNNDMIISWILNVVVEQISNNLNFVNSASKLWSELQEQYSQIDGFLDELDALEAPHLCICPCNCENGKENTEKDQRKRLIQFLMGLDESYANIRGQILLMQPLPTVVKAYGMVRHEEKQREGIMSKPNTPTIFSAFLNNQRNYTNPSRYTRGESSTTAERRSTFKKGVYCGNCSKERHTKAEFDARNFKSVNMVMGQTEQLETPATQSNPSPSDQHVSARMDQLQNQINQDQDQRIALGSLCNGLYLLDKAPNPPTQPRTVFRIKYNADGSLERFKAKLVAKGCTQKEGIDYKDTFAPVAKMVIVRALLATVVQHNWYIEQLYINNAFLHGDILEEVYMIVPQGYYTCLPPNTVCKLKKSLYGLKQANRQWFTKLTTFLLSLGFKQSYADTSLFTLQDTTNFLTLLVYVDDILLAEAEYRALADCTCEITWLKCLLQDLSIPLTGPTTIYCDNASIIALASNPIQHARTKHIELDCHFVRDKIREGSINPAFIPSKLQATDVLTKGDKLLLGKTSLCMVQDELRLPGFTLSSPRHFEYVQYGIL
ncbi:cysteine-rich receptor-like protein kinase 8 [Tanacetum coccineum]|uniref:Cysteine-rich receptor-like protein kinase 8 n=1 Tax=Tanacetum coccineum TaxID=301880 RepID=A0ABQ5GNU6_9ASTR